MDRNTYGGIFRRMYKMAQSAMRDHDIKVIYSISSKGDAHRVGKKLAKEYKIPWVAEFQDPWLDNQTLTNWIRDNSFRLYQYYWHKKTESFLRHILQKASLVVTESDGHRLALIHRATLWGINGDKIICSYLGSDKRIIDKLGEPIISHVVKESSIPKIGFIGDIYYGYEGRARSLVRCLLQLERQGTRFCLITAGSTLLPQLAREIGLSSILPLCRVSYKEAVGLMSVLDWGVTIPSSKININSKLFDYLQQGCRVLVWGCSDGDMASIVNRYNCGIVVNDSNEKNAVSELKRCITDGSKSRDTIPNNGWFTRRRQFEPVLEKIFEIVRNLNYGG